MGTVALGLALYVLWLTLSKASRMEDRIRALERRVSVLDDPFAPPPVGLDAPPHRER